MRILFAGTPEFALPSLQTLIDGDYDIAAVLTQPDRPAGRGKKLRVSPVKQLALETGLNVLQPDTLRDQDWQQRLRALQPDLMVVVAYGLMIPAQMLLALRLGGWNIHASLLPRWRGAAPVQRALEAGDENTGVCIMQMEATLDTGPVYHCLPTAIGPQDTAGSLHDRLADLGAQALQHCLNQAIKNQLPEPTPQDDSRAVYARKLSKAEAELDWNKSAEALQRQVRAFHPWPVAWCELGGRRLRIWQAEVVENPTGLKPGQVRVDDSELIIGTDDKALKILEIQRAGGKRMSVVEFLKAEQFQPI
ncbi:MAG: methionyl-tRNA formyltransferase [Gammaproteobacteria bacterium]|nr:MAG: methionyl-tRNA formyltransferase [Gammaproteobacteria bacterium]